MLSVTEIGALAALAVSLVSAGVAIFAWRQQRRAAQLVVNTHFLNDTLRMLADEPALLALHGVSEAELAAIDVTPTELVYMLNSIYAGQAFHAAGGAGHVRLSSYRLQLLQHPKFERAWREVIRERLTTRTAFTDAIDRHYRR